MSAGVWAEGEVYATTQYDNGQAVQVYTNAGAEKFHRTMRVKRNTANQNALIVNVPQQKSLAKKVERPARNFRAFNGTVPKVYTFAESGYRNMPRRAVFASRGGRHQADGRYVNISDIILQEARRHNIDPLIIECVIRQESNFDHLARSRSGAQGLMQLMPGTAADLGCTDPWDPEANVSAGTLYLAQQLSRFGDLRLALAAYNAGPGSVEAYGGIPPYDETINYVAKITADYESRKVRRSASR